MNTPAHGIFNLLLLDPGRRPERVLPIAAGAVLPDLPMVAFYLYQRLVAGSTEEAIWSEIYFRPHWQNLFDAFHSLPILGALAAITWWLRSPRVAVFFASMVLHSLADIPLHGDDAHGPFFPFSSWRFESPISYWDPARYGAWVSLAEIALVTIGSLWLWRRYQSRAAHATLAALAGVYMLFFGFAMLMWMF